MARLEDLTPGARVRGVLPHETVTVVAVRWSDTSAVELTYTDARGRPDNAVLYRFQEPDLVVIAPGFFLEAFRCLGGGVHERERGRYELTRVPGELRQPSRGGCGAVLSRYERATFEKALRTVPGKPEAAFLAPGHPLPMRFATSAGPSPASRRSLPRA